MKAEDSRDLRKGIRENQCMDGRSKSHCEFQKSRPQEMYYLTAWGCNANGQFPAGKDRSRWQTLGQGISALCLVAAQQDKNEVFGLGSNQFGQLGLKDLTHAHKPEIISAVKDHRIHFVACGAYHTFLLTSSNDLFTFGLNITGQLGLGHTSNVFTPAPVQFFQYEKGNFFDSDLDKEETLMGSGELVVNVQCGALHTVLLTSKNRLFAAGHGENYALGMGNKANHSRFKQIPLELDTIEHLACGVNHTGVIAGGKAYIWGTLSNKQQYKTPEVIVCDGSMDAPLRDLQMGDNFSLFLTTTGEVYHHGEIGHDEKSFIPSPKKIAGLPSISSIAVGNRFCFAVSQGQVFGWGLNNYGQVTGTIRGQQPKYITSPQPIRHMFAGAEPYRIICGWKHVMMLSAKTPFPQRDDKQNVDQKLKSEHEALKVINFQLLQKLQKAKDKKKGQNIRIQTDIPEERTRSPSLIKKNSKFEITGTQKHRTFNSNLEIDFKEIVLEKQISEGGYGIIYRAKWRETIVAVKMFKIENNDSAVRDFLSECHAMEALRHPNIVMFLGACTKPPNLCIVLEYCTRGSLWSTIQNLEIDLTWQDKKRFAIDTAKGMHYLHSCHPPILHRDLKSLNLLLDESFRVKLADFGWTKGLANYMTGKIGTYQWMAPQVIGGHQYTEKADVFSYAIILWEIAARQPPYRNISGVQVSIEVLNNDLRPNIPKRTPECFARLIKRCWERDPHKRPSFREVIRELEYMRFKQ